MSAPPNEEPGAGQAAGLLANIIAAASGDENFSSTLPKRLQGRAIDSAALSAARDAIEAFGLLVTDRGEIFSVRGLRLVKVWPSAMRDFARSRLGHRRRAYGDLRAAILMLAAAPADGRAIVRALERGDDDGH